MRSLIFVLAVCFPALACADFSISIAIDEPSSISSTLVAHQKTCTGTNQKTRIKHPMKVCDKIERDYSDVFSREPDTLPPASDEPTAQVKFESKKKKWSRTIGRVSGNSLHDKRLQSLTNDILKLNAK